MVGRHRGSRRTALDVVEQTAAARVEAPGDQHAADVEDEEAPKSRFHPAGETDRCAVSLRDEEGAESRDRRGKSGDRRRFFLRLADAGREVGLRHQPVDLLAHDVRDHLEGRRIADACCKEQDEEHREEAPERVRLILDAEEVQHAAHADHHQHEHPEGDAAAAPFVGNPSRRGARQRADQRAEEDERQRVDRRELRLGKQREAGRIADERAECAGVKPAHDPVVLAFEDHRLLAERGLGRGDVVHAEPATEGAGRNERHPDEAGVLQPQRNLLRADLRHDGFAAEPAEHAHGDQRSARRTGRR